MKGYSLIFVLLGVIVIFFFGCASMEAQFRMAKQTDNIETYDKFVSRYPNSPFTEEARKRLEQLKDEKAFREVEARNTITMYRDFIEKYPNSRFIELAKKRTEESDEEAFSRTWGIGTTQSFQGFIESYPQSKHVQTAVDRIEFLKGVRSGTIESYRKFIKDYPNNPFVPEAKASFPILWLSMREGKLGAVINVEEFVRWKGIFSRGPKTKLDVQHKVFDNLEKKLEKEGIDAVLMDVSEEPTARGVSTLLIIDCKEQESVSRPAPRSTGQGYAVDVLHQSTVDNISEILFGPKVNIYSNITIKDARTNSVYFSDIPGIYSKADKAQILWALGGMSDSASTIFSVHLPILISRLLQGGKCAELMRIQKLAVNYLIAVLSDSKGDDWISRAEAAEALGKLRDSSSVEPLIAALRVPDGDTRGAAAEALSNIGTKKVELLIDELIADLNDQDWRTRKDAAEILGAIKNKRAVEPLIGALKDKDLDVRMLAAESLGEIKDTAAVEPLLSVLLTEELPFVRNTIASVLGEIGDERAIGLLKAVAENDSSDYVRATAKEAVDKIQKANQ